MKLTSDSIRDGQPVPADFAFGAKRGSPEGEFTFAHNRSPHLAWSEVPAGALSFVLTCHDPDVPSSGEDVNQAGRTVPVDLPRVDFTHWVLVGLPAHQRSLAAGADGEGIVPHGKPPGPGPAGVRGLNDYTSWFSGDPTMAGLWAGYDGPCPPWNDERLHHYIFTVYALDREIADWPDPLERAALLAVIGPHVLAQASITGIYSMYAPVMRAHGIPGI